MIYISVLMCKMWMDELHFMGYNGIQCTPTTPTYCPRNELRQEKWHIVSLKFNNFPRFHFSSMCFCISFSIFCIIFSYCYHEFEYICKLQSVVRCCGLWISARTISQCENHTAISPSHQSKQTVNDNLFQWKFTIKIKLFDLFECSFLFVRLCRFFVSVFRLL